MDMYQSLAKMSGLGTLSQPSQLVENSETVIGYITKASNDLPSTDVY